MGSPFYWDRHRRQQPDGMVVYRREACEERSQVHHEHEEQAPQAKGDNWLVAAVTGNDVRQNW